jgi:phage gp16-like protein
MSAPFKKKDPAARRRAALAKLHCWRRDAKLDEAVYRAFLKGVTGKESAAQLSERELGAVLDAIRARGFRSPATSAPNQRSSAPQERLAIGLWRDLGELPGVLDDPSDEGLRRFAARMTGVDSMAWADAMDMNKIIEALKAWRRREYESRGYGTANQNG